MRYAGRGGAVARAPGLLNVERAARLAAAGALLAPTAAAVAARCGQQAGTPCEPGMLPAGHSGADDTMRSAMVAASTRIACKGMVLYRVELPK